MATLLAIFHLPLPVVSGHRSCPCRRSTLRACGWRSSSALTFTGIYAYRVAEEARLLETALSATELVLQREQHLSALDGLAAAAAHELGTPLATISVVAREMERGARRRSALPRGCHAAQVPKRTLPGYPSSSWTSLSSEGEAHYGAAAADLADRGGDRAASRFRRSSFDSSPAGAKARNRSDAVMPESSTGSEIS